MNKVLSLAKPVLVVVAGLVVYQLVKPLLGKFIPQMNG